MTGLLDLTAELPVWAVAVAGLASFLLGTGTRAAGRLAALVTRRCAGRLVRRDSCSNCRTAAARHARLTATPAWLGWPGHHAAHLPYGYGDHLDPGRLEPAEKLPLSLAPAPTGPEVRAWVLTERVIEAAGWEATCQTVPAAAALPPPVHPRSPFARGQTLDEFLLDVSVWPPCTTTQLETLT